MYKANVSWFIDASECWFLLYKMLFFLYWLDNMAISFSACELQKCAKLFCLRSPCVSILCSYLGGAFTVCRHQGRFVWYICLSLGFDGDCSGFFLSDDPFIYLITLWSLIAHLLNYYYGVDKSIMQVMFLSWREMSITFVCCFYDS